MRHRGPDSTGFAVYGAPRERGYVVRGYLADRDALDGTLQQVTDLVRAQGSDLTGSRAGTSRASRTSCSGWRSTSCPA